MAANKNIKINLDYSEFSGGIQDCQRKMGLLTEQFKMQQSALGNNASEVDKLSLAQSSLSQKIELQVQIVEKAEQRYKALAQSEEATSSQVDKAQKAFMQQITKLNQLTNELNKVNGKLEETEKDENQVSNSSSNASKGFDKMKGSVASALMGITAFVQGMKQATSEISAFATKASSMADDLKTLSSQTGVSTQTLQEWGYASNFVDVSVDTLQSSMTKLTQNMAEAQNGSVSAQQAFSNLGVSVTNADGSLKSAEQVFYSVIDALGNVSNQAERDASAMDIFGRSAQELNPLIDQGSEALRKYGEEAQNLGIVMSSGEIDALNQAQDGFDKLSAVIDASANRVSASVAPAFSEFANILSGLPQPVLDFGTAIGKTIEVSSNSISTISQLVQTMTALKTAKVVTTIATVAETDAEVGLAIAADAANASLAPQIIAVGALVLVLYKLAQAIKEMVELFHDYNDALEKAGQETMSFSEFAFGSSDSGSSNSGTKHYALGGRTTGGQVWVGEQGAELVDLPAGSYVHNTTESNLISNGGNVTNITVNVDHISELSDLLRISQQAKQRSRMGVNS